MKSEHNHPYVENRNQPTMQPVYVQPTTYTYQPVAYTQPAFGQQVAYVQPSVNN